MKKTIIASVLLSITTISTGISQSLTVRPGLDGAELFHTNVGESISGLECFNGVNMYYLLQRSGASTQLVSRYLGAPSSSPSVVFDYGTSVFGSFVKRFGDKLYFSESTTNTLRTFDLSTGMFSTLATIGGAYDIDFAGGFGWVSANPGFAGNKVLKLDLTTGVTTTALTSSDFSGPVTFVGGTGFEVSPGVSFPSIYRYSLAELNAGGLTLDAAHRWLDNGGNAYFETQQGALVSTNFSDLTVLFPDSGGYYDTIGSSPDSIGNLAADGFGVYATVTDFNSFATSTDDRSAVYRVFVPEPATAGLLGISLGILTFRRRKS